MILLMFRVVCNISFLYFMLTFLFIFSNSDFYTILHVRRYYTKNYLTFVTSTHEIFPSTQHGGGMIRRYSVHPTDVGQTYIIIYDNII